MFEKKVLHVARTEWRNCSNLFLAENLIGRHRLRGFDIDGRKMLK
jgi:hypothetical protein